MVDIGSFNQLKIKKTAHFGAYLDGGHQGLIPISAVDLPIGVDAGSEISVFLYHNSDMQVVATTVRPAAQVGHCALLSVVEINSTGAFLEWGLPKHLLLPFNEQKPSLKVGQACFVYVFLDKYTNRIASSMKLSRHLLERNESFKVHQSVDLHIAARTDLGYKAVIDNHSLGLIFESDAYLKLRVGDYVKGSIKRIRADGRIDLYIASSKSEVDEELSGRILQHLRDHGGSSRLTDKSPPHEIYKEFKVSKNKFKNALGGLYKSRRVTLTQGSVKLAG